LINSLFVNNLKKKKLGFLTHLGIGGGEGEVSVPRGEGGSKNMG